MITAVWNATLNRMPEERGERDDDRDDGTPRLRSGDFHGRAAFGNLRRRMTNATICIMYEMTAPNTAMKRMTPVAVDAAVSVDRRQDDQHEGRMR